MKSDKLVDPHNPAKTASNQRLNLHHLFIFYSVAQHSSFSKAAIALEITQPAVSIQINELETSLGTQLFHRRSRNLRVTDTGKIVLRYAQNIFALSNDLIQNIEEIKGLNSGNLTIGASTTPGEYILPSAVGQFRQIHPGIQVEITIANTRDIVRQMLEHEIDLAMVGNWPGNLSANLEISEYMTDEIVLVTGPDCMKVNSGHITLDQVAKEGLVLREEGSATRSIAEDFFHNLGVTPRINVSVGSNQAVKQAASAGGGIGVISKLGVTAEVKAGTLKVLTVKDWSCKRPLLLVKPKTRHLSPSQEAFLTFLDQTKPSFTAI